MRLGVGLFLVWAALLFNVNHVGADRIQLRRDRNGHWHFARGGEQLPFNIGWNHFHFLTDPCPHEDIECKNAELFEKLYHSNASAAALGALSQFHDLAFTGGGYDSVPPEHMANLPFLRSMFLFAASEWSQHPQFDDPWDSQTLARVDQRILQSCIEVQPYRENVLGYIFNDALAYNISRSQQIHGSDWVSSLRCLSKAAPGNQQYKAFLKMRYNGNLIKLCSVYDLSGGACQSWDSLDLCPVKNTNASRIMDDDQAFMPILAGQIYSHVSSALRACDPEAILLGDNFGAYDAPEEIIDVMVKYVDAITVQLPLNYFNQTYLPLLHSRFEDFPIVVADMGFSFPHAPYTHYEWPEFSSQEEAGKVYRDFVVGAAQTGYIVSVNKCGYIDRVEKEPNVALKPGILDFNGSLHHPIASLIQSANMAAQGKSPSGVLLV